jgi:uncharacterized protein YndB with AHSA1/START domain
MTAPKPKSVTTGDAVIVEVEIAAPPERVFQALTDEKQLFTWWGSEPSVNLITFTMDGSKGGRYHYACTPKGNRDFGPITEQLKQNGEVVFDCHGEVLEIDPPRLLVWSWIANWHKDPKHATIVRWELSPSKAGTLVRVTHNALANEPEARKDYGSGWQGVLQLLKNFLHG